MNHRVCAWCEALNITWPGRESYCHRCGHRAEVSKAQCDCPPCLLKRMAAGEPTNGLGTMQEQAVEVRQAVADIVKDERGRTVARLWGATEVECTWFWSAESVTCELWDVHAERTLGVLMMNRRELASLLAQVDAVHEMEAIMSAAQKK